MKTKHISNLTKETLEFVTNDLLHSSGNYAIDYLINGFKPGELICFCGVGGCGKNTLLRSIICFMTLEQKLPVAYFCPLGIGAKRIIAQFLGYIAGIPFNSWTSPKFSNNEINAIQQATKILDDAPLYTNFDTSVNIDQIENDIEKLVKDKYIKIVFIDNFQGIKTEEPSKAFRDVSIRLKNLAQQLNISIIVTSYLNWWIWDREGFEAKFPHLEDLARVGDLNDISDIVLGIYRPELDHVSMDELGNDLKDKLRIEVLKSYRNNLNYEYTKFSKKCLSFE